MRSTAALRSIAALGMAFACASIAATAVAQEAEPAHPHAIHHHLHNGPHRQVHRLEAHPVQPAAAPAPAVPQAAPFGLSWPHIAPYPDNKGDEDGLSEDANDCNKGCIDGAPN
jgi:hypothetical protein